MPLTYAQLSTALQDYLQTTEASFVANIPLFVSVTEERIYNTVQFPALRKSQIGTMTAANQYLTAPTDWLANFSLSVIDPITGAQTYLLNKDVEFIRETFPVPTATGTPTHYAVFSPYTFILGPTPDLNYQTECIYYHYPTSIVTAGTSWLGNNFENLLLYGALREAYIYLKGEQDMITYYENKYQEGIALLKGYGEGKIRRDAYRSGQTRTDSP